MLSATTVQVIVDKAGMVARSARDRLERTVTLSGENIKGNPRPRLERAVTLSGKNIKGNPKSRLERAVTLNGFKKIFLKGTRGEGRNAPLGCLVFKKMEPEVKAGTCRYAV